MKEERVMRKYKGYYIDGVIFTTEKEIDDFHRNSAVESYRKAVEIFVKHPTMESSVYCDEKAENLMKYFGYTCNEVEAIEIDVYKTMAAG